jgi:hypothetical protein
MMKRKDDELIKKFIQSVMTRATPEMQDSTPTEILSIEYGCSYPIAFNTSEGRKTMYPGKRYNENFEEIAGE